MASDTLATCRSPLEARLSLISRLALTLALLAVTLACGLREDPADSRSGEAVAEATVEEAEPAEVADAEARPAEPVLTRTLTPDGEVFEAEFGKAGQLPSNFPADVPVYENATPLSSMASPQHGTVVNLRSTDPPGDVFAWYRDRYEAAGWEIESAQQERSRSTLVARKGNRVSSLVLTHVPGATQALLQVAEDR